MFSFLNKKPSAVIKKQGYINTPKDIKDALNSILGCTVVNADEANYANVKRINYRVIVPVGVTDAHLLKIFKELDLKKYDEVTIWCYKSIDEIEQYKPFTIAMLERKSKRAAVQIERR